jgi:serine/threonine-protein kinase SRPK3
VEEANRIARFLTPMLELLPEGRANAGGMSSHEFMQGTIGMEKAKLDIPLGSKGEGIEGWASEVKKR